MPHYQFRPMSADDLPLLRDWLARPHVAEWWHDADEFAFVSGDLGHHDMAQFIVSIDGRPFGYLQCYRMSDWDAGFGPQPDGTRGIDQFIGEPEHGRTRARLGLHPCVHRRIARHRHAARRDRSDPANARAIRAYEKAGFGATAKSIRPTASPS